MLEGLPSLGLPTCWKTQAHSLSREVYHIAEGVFEIAEHFNLIPRQRGAYLIVNVHRHEDFSGMGHDSLNRDALAVRSWSYFE